MKYQICWQYQKSEEVKKGKPSENRQALDAWVKDLNKRYPEIDHWTSECADAQ